MGLPAYNARLQKINIKTSIQECFRLEGFDIIESIRHQMLRGKRGDDNLIGKYSSPIYAIDKEKQNPLAGFGNVDLKLTGAFQGGIYIKFGNYNFTIGSNDSKAPKLETDYGNLIYQPGAGARTEFIPKVQSRLVQSLVNQLR